MIYFDNAATSYPKPSRVYEGMDRFAREFGANPGRSGHHLAVEAESRIDAVRRQIAELFGGRDPRRVVFTLNATDALNMVFRGGLDRGDHVVTTRMEHNSVTRPLSRMEQQGILSLTWVEPRGGGGIVTEKIEEAITGRTRMIVVGHASNVTGDAAPISEIGALARSRDLFFTVDSAQSAGLLPIDLEEMNIDFLAFTGHKALLGPTGTGGLVVGKRGDLRPWREGGTGGDSSSPLQPPEFPHRLEAGTPNTAGIAGLGEALRFVTEKGLDALGDKERDLGQRLWRTLAKDDRFILYGTPPGESRDRTGVVSLNLRGADPAEVGGVLDSAFDIAVRTGLHCAPGTHRFLGTFPDGTVRVSPGPFNTPEEIDALVAALTRIAAGGF